MTELEKLKAMLPFNTDDAEVMEAKKRARKLAAEFNNSGEDAPKRRTEILTELFGDCTEDIFIKPPFRCDYGFNIHVGKKFFANYDCVMLDAGPIHIGDYCLLGPKTCIYTVSHDINPRRRAEGASYAKPVNIGDNVWLGGNCIVLPGVTIGNNAIVGAGSVVTKDVPENAVVAGNPARVLRYLTKEELES